jgi:starch-binding outer membrane protein, SusD/RagB family
MSCRSIRKPNFIQLDWMLIFNPLKSKKMYKKIISFILVLGIMGGCTKAPTSEVSPTDQYATGNYPASMDDVNSVLAACYSNLRDQYLFGFDYLTKMMANATHTSDGQYGAGDFGGFVAINTLSPSNGMSGGVWQSLYVGVKNCNVSLASDDSYAAKYAKPGDLQALNFARGQAYFLRAYYYFQLENLFGEDNLVNPSATDTLGVPLFIGLPTSLETTQQPRSSIKAVWAQIISDLQQAATLLKGQVWTGNDIARATEWSAKSLLGKAYVFTKDWADAKTTLLDVIQMSGKTLMSYDNYRASFIGDPQYEFNQESIFELNIDPNSNGDYGVYGGPANATSINGLIWSPYALGGDGTEQSSNPMGYGGNIGLHDVNVLRFGYTLGTYTLVNNPNFDNTKPASFSNPKMVMDPVYKAKALAARTNGTVDPRLYVNCVQPWLDSLQWAAPSSSNWYPVSRPSYIFGDANLSSEFGWGMRKYASLFNNIGNNPEEGNNKYILRLADVYLLYAETAAASGDNATALEYLNKVKRRAYNLPVDVPSAIDYTSLTATTSAANASDPVLGNNPLYYERWAELFNEGSWWFDVCRWHLGASEDALYVTARSLNGAPFVWTDKSYAWPIPIGEINSNPKVASQQNPGY